MCVELLQIPPFTHFNLIFCCRVAKDLFERECSDEVIVKSPILVRLLGRDFQKNIHLLSALVAGEMAYVK